MESNNCIIETLINEKNWNKLLNILRPKYFPRTENGKLISPRVVAKIADTLINTSTDTPEKVKIVIIKCLMNSCVNDYIPKEYDTQSSISTTDSDFYAFLYKNYINIPDGSTTDEYGYQFLTYFPYDGVAKWAADFISEFSLESKNLSDDQLELLRLSLQLLCNLGKSSSPCVQDENFKKATMMLIQHDHLPVSRAACAFIHNALILFNEDYYSDTEKNELTISLIKPVKLEIPSAIDALKYLLKQPQILQNIYDKISIEDRLYLLETILHELREAGSSDDTEFDLPSEVISFLSNCFKRKSDLVLKTVDTYLDGVEPMEITILLDILGVLTSKNFGNKNYENNLQDDKSLLINCIFLLKSLHMAGKESNNFFTPVQKISEFAPSGQYMEVQKANEDIQSHPAFGFKAGLIRVIGNMVHKHKSNQDLVRETDGIPLLLDCCNIDARNPLIIQWTILAMRNICENNAQNQDVVRGLNKIGVADSAILHEIGLVLHDEGDGKAVGIMALNKS